MSGKNLLILLLLLGIFTAVLVIARKPKPETGVPAPPGDTGARKPPETARIPKTPEVPSDPWKLFRWAMDYSAYGDEAVEAGGSLPGPEANAVLMYALSRDDDEYEDEDLAIRALYVLASRKTLGVEAKIESCLEENDWDWIGEWAAKALAFLESDDALRVLVRLTHNDEEEARQAAAIALAGREAPDALDAVKSLTSDEDDEVSSTAVGVLLSFGDADAAGLIEEVLDEEDEFMDAALAYGLGVPGNSAALPWLDRIIAREDPDAQMEAARALGAIRDAGGVERLKKLMESEDQDVAAIAAAALARDFGDTGVADALRDAVKNLRDFEYRTEALRALISLGRKSDLPFIRDVFANPFPPDCSDREMHAQLVVKFWAAHGLLALE